MRLFVRKTIKEIYCNLCRGHCLIMRPFNSRKSYLTYDEAFSILDCNRHVSASATSIKACNCIDTEYDLHIIIPAYNVEKYINRCISSVLKQRTKFTYYVTIIDDGSTDKTGRVLDEKFGNVDSIRIIHQNNGGIAQARNKGLEEIKGKYVMFVDSDDYLLENSIEVLMDEAISNNADVVQGGYFSFDNNDRIISSYVPNINRNDKYNLVGTPWAKVFKSEMFRNLKFPKLEYEDSIFAYCIFPKANNICVVNELVYAYRNNTAGISHVTKTSERAIDHYWIIGFLWEWGKNNLTFDNELQMKILDHMALGYNRCKLLSQQIVEAGFVYLRYKYLDISPGNTNLYGKYKQMDNAIRNADFGEYELLSKHWPYL